MKKTIALDFGIRHYYISYTRDEENKPFVYRDNIYYNSYHDIHTNSKLKLNDDQYKKYSGHLVSIINKIVLDFMEIYPLNETDVIVYDNLVLKTDNTVYTKFSHMRHKDLFIPKLKEKGYKTIGVNIKSSQTCSKCGHKNKSMSKLVDKKILTCSNCNLVINRDKNACVNIYNEYFKNYTQLHLN